MDADDLFLLKELIKNHYKYTGSEVADKLLKDWDSALKHFVKVMPTDYKAVLLKKKQLNQGTRDKEVLING
jgi:glutamate synthase (NADPH/NADH) large chain